MDPDIVIDNLPHATFQGNDAQLDAAVKHLLVVHPPISRDLSTGHGEEIKKRPVEVPKAPAYPKKARP